MTRLRLSNLFLPLALLIIAFATNRASALGTSCTAPIASGTAAAGAPFWLQSMTHQGTSAFNANPSTYQVFRNVKDFGATGNGVTDDTAAIMSAMTSGGRCGGGSCGSSTLTPAIVYFPAGTYLVSSAIQMYYYTQMIGDARTPPTLLASASFSGAAVIDADPYVVNGGGAQWYGSTDLFFLSVRNLVVDLRQMGATSGATGIHWQVSQATSIMNFVVWMSTASGNNHRGPYGMENGSGGFMGDADMVFNGGQYGMQVGNQQFTVRNVTINNANTGKQAATVIWNGRRWTFQRATINNCQVGFALTTGGTTQANQGVESETIIDAVVTNTPTFIEWTATSTSLAGSLVLNNIQITNVPVVVGAAGTTVLAGTTGSTTINSWAQGNVYSGTSGTGTYTKGTIPNIAKASSLLDSSGHIVGKSHPQYINYDVSQFVSVKTLGAKGDGHTDDTATLQAILNEWSGCKIIFFDAGTYIITSTLQVPAGTQMVGEAWTQIMGSGSAFSNINSPEVVVQAGAPNSVGVLEVSDFVFTTAGPTPGAIMVEWNVHDPSGQQAAAGMWDTHVRFVVPVGTDLQQSNCPTSNPNNNCYAAFLGLHLTSASSAYLEGTWVWLADHDLDGTAQVTVYSGRGIYSQSQGPVWFIGTSEHHTLYQYSLVGAANHYIGFAQTETPYYQPDPAPPSPYTSLSSWNDPTSYTQQAAWALSVATSSNILIFGAGHYSFFQNYNTTCENTFNCQSQIVNVDSYSSVAIYGLATVATTYQISLNAAGVVPNSANRNGFAQTVTEWTPSNVQVPPPSSSTTTTSTTTSSTHSSTSSTSTTTTTSTHSTTTTTTTSASPSATPGTCGGAYYSSST
ncbi:glycoside hydrolase family 55 protein [Jaapia argillacea MUCL 33604]|uniref:Glycoside hydrolase family 55 protein n=1 Tax=Jaapia argillacea MUCL 33604 TaxID=933084 RepID=A0A067PQ84_9AGAM|nr:glycoside hydrolase family 55 protein [Jaapia argillacea MUCL 33604]